MDKIKNTVKPRAVASTIASKRAEFVTIVSGIYDYYKTKPDKVRQIMIDRAVESRKVRLQFLNDWERILFEDVAAEMKEINNKNKTKKSKPVQEQLL